MKKVFLLFVTTALLFGCKKEDDSNIDQTPAIPVAVKGYDASSTSFTAKWNASENAESYEIDLAMDRYFNMIERTEKTNNTVLGFLGLTTNLRYFYRVRAVNGTIVSGNSNVIDILTLPEPPIALPATGISQSGFTVNWNWTPNITSYLLYVSTEDFPHDDSKNLPAYNGKIVVSNTHQVTGLNNSSKYYHVLRSANGSNISANSNTISCTTLN